MRVPGPCGVTTASAQRLRAPQHVEKPVLLCESTDIQDVIGMTHDSAANSARLLSDSGPFVAILQGFIQRPQQQEMAAAIEQALLDRGNLVVEAGTGTGKTLAYLVPAIMSGKTVIVSTGTRNLQDQLFSNDIPLIRDALDIPFSASILKGRANYVCPHRLELSLKGEQDGAGYLFDELDTIRKWSARTLTGDIAEITGVEENSAVWPNVTSTVDNCLGPTCAKIGECPVYQARARANEADLIVVNHHLLFADLLLKEEGIGHVLPSADGIVLDEAHQLADIAGRFFGSTLSSRQLTELARDVLKEQFLLGNDDYRLITAAQELERSSRELQMAFPSNGTSRTWTDLCSDGGVREAVGRVDGALIELMDILEETSVRSKGLQSCFHRSSRLADLFAMLTEEVVTHDYVHWLESTDRSFVIHLSPISIAEQFSTLMHEKDCSWVFTSATLAVGESFDHFLTSLGIEDEAQVLKLESPFDFERQTLFYVPEEVVYPSDSDYTSVVVERALPVIQACQGRTFFLFTSYRALDEAAQKLAGESDFVCFVQGTLPKSELLYRFLNTERSVLLATSSFWEGVDVKGDLLSCVIIDKLPFMSPADPIVKARLEAMTDLGVNGFYHYMLPQAAISLKQGFGRLIRDEVDKGIFMLGDPRILTSSYGKVFLANLPTMPLTRSLREVESFLESIE